MPDSIHWASAYGESETLKEIIASAHPRLLNKLNRHGMTPLHAAAFHGHFECVKVLLDAGADPNVPSSGEKFTFPLHLAVTRIEKEIAELLLVEGRADANLKDYLGQTPLDIARSLCIENDSLARDEELNAKFIHILQDSIAKVHGKSLKPFTFVSSHHSKRQPLRFFKETDLPSPPTHSEDFFKSETAIKRF
jgi:hypothetical protein